MMTAGNQLFELTDEQTEAFAADGFVVVEQIIDPSLAPGRSRYEDLFGGRFETGLYPDEWNWRAGRDPDDLTRQICNAWKSDREIARVVLRDDIGRACARLGGWPGVRLSQDNVLWKPPGGRALGFHQDSSYEQWAVPPSGPAAGLLSTTPRRPRARSSTCGDPTVGRTGA